MSIKLDHVTYVYSGGTAFERKALDDICLEIPDGQFVGMIGHTGSGKSTLIQHLNPGAASAEEGSPDFAFGNFQIQIVNYEEDYLTSPKEDANQFCLGVIASATTTVLF